MGISDAWLSGEFGADAQERLRQLHEHAEREPLPLTGDWPVGPDNTSKKFPVPEAKSYEFPWYQSVGHGVTNNVLQWLPWRWGQVGTAHDNATVQNLAGPANPFNAPAQIHHGVDTTMQGWRLGDAAMMGQGALEAGLGAAGPAYAGVKGANRAMLWNQQRQRDNMLSQNLRVHHEPIDVFHGTTKEFSEVDPKKLKDFGFHVGTREQAEIAAGQNGRIMELTLGRPGQPTAVLDVLDSYAWMPDRMLKDLQSRGVYFTPEQVKAITGATKHEAYPIFRQALDDHGIDALRYVNINEKPGQLSWIAFKPNTVFDKKTGARVYGVPGVLVGGGAYGLAGDPRHAEFPRREMAAAAVGHAARGVE